MFDNIDQYGEKHKIKRRTAREISRLTHNLSNRKDLLKVVEANLNENQDIVMIFMPRKGSNKRAQEYDQGNNSDDLSLSDVSEIYKNIDDFQDINDDDSLIHDKANAINYINQPVSSAAFEYND